MFNLLKKYDNNREQNMPPDFIPQKQQGQKLFGPEPVIEPQWQPQGPGPVISGGNHKNHQKLQICIGRFAYLWLDNGAEFWFFVQGVTPRYIFGWRFRNGRLERGRIVLSRIETFYCHKRD